MEREAEVRLDFGRDCLFGAAEERLAEPVEDGGVVPLGSAMVAWMGYWLSSSSFLFFSVSA